MSYTGKDFYCDVALKDKARLDIEFETENVLAFRHTNPHWPVHIVVIPKKCIASFTALTDEDEPILLELIDVMKKIAARVEQEHGAARILTNLGKYQDSKHLHFHISSGKANAS